MPDDGGPAFPTRKIVQAGGGPAIECRVPGMSLRDWFAAAALNGLLAECAHPDVVPSAAVDATLCAVTAYRVADAMIAERTKRQEADQCPAKSS